jgi:aminoglycoside 3-N-acetyltransferase
MRRKLKGLLLKHLPTNLKLRLKRLQARRLREAIDQHPPLSERDFAELLRAQLRIRPGSVLFIHNSIGLLNLQFPIKRLLELLREAVGPEGTLVYPTFPKESSLDFLQSGVVFNVLRTASFTGILGECARRMPGAVRSLHPTRSVCAIGPEAGRLTATHHLSPYPFSDASPFKMLVDRDATIIGLGISTKNLTFVHTVEDHLWPDFPVKVYHPTLFSATCVDVTGKSQVVKTFAHDMSITTTDVPGLIAHVDPVIARDFKIGPMDFFTVEARPLFCKMVASARQGITIYSTFPLRHNL